MQDDKPFLEPVTVFFAVAKSGALEPTGPRPQLLAVLKGPWSLRDQYALGRPIGGVSCLFLDFHYATPVRLGWRRTFKESNFEE